MARIGKVKTRDEKGEVVWRVAKWDALVDESVSARVQSEVARREGEPRNLKRTAKGIFLVRPVCAHCGVEYHGGRLKSEQGAERTYVHGTPDKRLHPDVYTAYMANGCRAWTVTARRLRMSS